ILAALSAFSGVPPADLERSSNLRSRWFERFVVWHLVRHRHLDRLAPADLDGVITGASDDNQIDGLLILANGEAMSSRQDVEELLRNERLASIQLVILQVTLAQRFAIGKLESSVAGVRRFLQEPRILPENEGLAIKRLIKKRLLAGVSAGTPVPVQVYYYL